MISISSKPNFARFLFLVAIGFVIVVASEFGVRIIVASAATGITDDADMGDMPDDNSNLNGRVWGVQVVGVIVLVVATFLQERQEESQQHNARKQPTDGTTKY